MSAPKVTLEGIRAKIVDREFFYSGLLTICVLTLVNGIKVVGKSACVYPENYDRVIGQDLAIKDAEQQCWALEGYLLAEHRTNGPVGPVT